ncbi:MAG: hypothetical protein KGK01_02135 [Bradyrhizobium sp.]|uniref:hypothetical protein n=1 Tax=Bradyrhizobium sp. TaxID=376 RepID=UPI001C283429|nr:hypothetical protein [Bradyrhizobium sp.]MBU6461918.1 hypothetical protein [Pseudomonadota bacterium]MDE2066895.1 hypothetical protein [Bradyrhizobium sp.]MDE2241263.1 hypothetical protein [Bradyrhizobium sp.]MDE2470097.1 hypothetical protein [Bradyrhizobium sp.]
MLLAVLELRHPERPGDVIRLEARADKFIKRAAIRGARQCRLSTSGEAKSKQVTANSRWC